MIVGSGMKTARAADPKSLRDLALDDKQSKIFVRLLDNAATKINLSYSARQETNAVAGLFSNRDSSLMCINAVYFSIRNSRI
jgi:hypothetical protein